MHLSERKLLILTLVAIVLVVAGGGAWGYYRYTTSQELQTQIKALRDQLDERQRKSKTVDELKTRFQSEAFLKEEAALDVHLPLESKTGDTDFWLMLNRMRKTTHPHVIIRRVEPVVERGGASGDGFKVPAGVRKLLYTIDIRGSFYDVLEYMSELETADRIVRIDRFDFKRRSGADTESRQGVLIEATLAVMAFEYQKPAGVAPAAAAR